MEIKNKELELYKKYKSKLNYKKVSKLLAFQPISYQGKILDYAQKADFNVLVAVLSRRAGKSTTMSVLGTGELIIPYASVLLITPTFQNAKAIFDKIERYVRQLNLPIKTRDSKALTFTLENEAKIMVVSQKNYENALGQYFTMVIIDEAGSIDNIKEIWETYISPAQTDAGLMDNGSMWSKTYFIGTARTYETDFYKIYERTKTRDRYIAVEATIYDNPLVSKELVKSIKESVDERTWEQEYLCIWQKSGAGESVYYAFNAEKHILKESDIKKKINRNNTYIVGLDWGHTDDTAQVIAVVIPFSGEIIVLDEYAQNKMPLRKHVENFKAKETKWTDTNPIRYGDPSGTQVIADLAYEHNYYVLPAPAELEEAVRAINRLFEQNKLFISDKCTKLIKQIKLMQWKENSKQIQRTKEESHFDLALGAFRYLVFGWEKGKNIQIQSI